MLWSFALSCLVLFLVIVASFTQPAALGWLLLFVTMVMILYYYLLGFYWGSLALFIVFVGGLLVAFSFISATASNWTLAEYFSLVWWVNMLLIIFSLALLFASSNLLVLSGSGLISAVRTVVDSPMVTIFWLGVAALLLVLLAGVKMCVGFHRPLHWLK